MSWGGDKDGGPGSGFGSGLGVNEKQIQPIIVGKFLSLVSTTTISIKKTSELDPDKIQPLKGIVIKEK